MYKYLIIKQFNSETGKQEETLFAEDILNDEMIDKKVTAKIRKEYSIDKECDMIRLGVLNGLDKEFEEYNNFVENCKAWGAEQKIIAKQERLTWKDKYRRKNEKEKDYIARLKDILPK